MTTDDPRHGTYAGYNAGCRQVCCRAAAARYQKKRNLERLQGGRRKVDSTGTRRRIEALMWLGWSMYDIADRAGRHKENVRKWHDEPVVYAKTAALMAEVYEAMSMLAPPIDTKARRQIVSRTRNLARARGYAPPLAWDDIDTDREPTGVRSGDELSRRRVTAAVLDQRACDRCGVVRQARNRTELCADCKPLVREAS